MITVYLVDNKTRIGLPVTAWSTSVLEKLGQMGHVVQATGQNWALVKRDNQETLRVARLLDSTGL